METLEQANQELERLCKAVQRLHHDLADAQQEAEVITRTVTSTAFKVFPPGGSYF